MAATLVSSNLTSGFIDLATYDELEKYMYGSKDAVTYFVRDHRKSTWFTQVPTVLARSGGTPGFDQEWSANITRAGDYLLYTWIRLDLPSVTFNAASTASGLRWTKNLFHNLVREIAVTFNDLSAYRIDSYFLDFWTAFTTPASKKVGYNNMIGNVSDLFNPVAPGETIRGLTLNLPIPTFFSRDSGVALPTAALPYNDMKIQVWFRDWRDLLIVDDITVAAGSNPSRPAVDTDLSSGIPTITNAYMWANYGIVSSDERRRMGCGKRDILIEQVQTSTIGQFSPATNSTPSYDLRFSHAVKLLFFAAENSTTRSQRSNYVNTSPLPAAGPTINYNPVYPSATDPIADASLIYENQARLNSMGVDYFSLVQPWYQKGATIPEVTGYHMYSYSLEFLNVNPMGSTNYGKLTNVSLVPRASQFAIDAASGTLATPAGAVWPTWWPQSFRFVVVAVNNNVIRINGGVLGFPVL